MAPTICEVCNKSFSKRRNMLRHQREVHDESTHVECPQCYRHFSRRSDLNEHLNTCRGNTPSTSVKRKASPIPSSQQTKPKTDTSDIDKLFDNVKMDPNENILQWKHPFTCIVAGPSGSGKTNFVLQLLQNAHNMFTHKPQVINWYYGEFQKWMMDPKYTEIEFVEGLPTDIDVDPQKANVFVIDDLMHETNEIIAKLFTKGSHHKNISVILLTQNMFHQNKHSRCINLNAHYMVIFKNVRDASQITNLAKQMYPGNVRYLRDSYTEATSKPYGYLMIDLKPDSPDLIRLRTDIFPGQIHYMYHKL